MPLLVRKIEKAKWMQNDIISGSDVSADAITNCLKTGHNRLSVWEIDKPGEYLKAALAFASAMEHLDSFDLVVLGYSKLEEAGLRIVTSEGRTKVQGMAETHRDIAELTYTTLGILAGLIVEEIRSGEVKRITVTDIRQILREAIEAGRLYKEDLCESLQNKI